MKCDIEYVTIKFQDNVLRSLTKVPILKGDDRRHLSEIQNPHSDSQRFLSLRWKSLYNCILYQRQLSLTAGLPAVPEDPSHCRLV